jgi:hypothetical protein
MDEFVPPTDIATKFPGRADAAISPAAKTI